MPTAPRSATPAPTPAPALVPAHTPAPATLPTGVRIASNSVYLEQFATGFYGKGMRADEQPNVVTERAIVAAAPAGSDTIAVLDTSIFRVGGSCSIRHANSKYWTYSITAKTFSTLTVSPPLFFPVDIRSSIERTWFDEAHAGKFYIRQLAQRIAGELTPACAARVVLFGDSWIAGDPLTADRESLSVQLALELPAATIVNRGRAGDRMSDLIARFENDVDAQTPDVVVFHVGTNDSYNPESAIFVPDAVDHFVQSYRTMIARVEATGGRAIILGVPALAETDLGNATFVSWLLNDRAKIYRDTFHRSWGLAPGSVP